MIKKSPDELRKMLLEMESEVDDSKIAGKKGKLKGSPANIAGKIYRDIFGIRREGNIYTNPNAVVVNTLKHGKHIEWDLIPISDKPLKKQKQFVRRAKIRIGFQCCYNGNPMNDPIELDVELEDIYNNRNEAYKISNLQNWLHQAFRESVTNISEEECSDWNEAYAPCEGKRKLLEILRDATENYEGYITTGGYITTPEIEEYEKERQQELIKREEKKKKAELKKAIKIAKEQKEKEQKIEKKIEEEKKIAEQLEERGIKYEPIPVPTKKELTTIDITHINRIQKDISKWEKEIKTQTGYLNIALGAIERLRESGQLQYLLTSVVARDRAMDKINITNTKIERQKIAIEKIRGI